jgi:hypothetical protein
MLVNRRNYDPRSLVNRTNPKGVENLGIVVRCPTLVGNRLVYFDYNHVGQGMARFPDGLPPLRQLAASAVNTPLTIAALSENA